MQEICAEVGLGPGAVYRYFSRKDEIIAAMAKDERRQVRTMLAEFHDTDYPSAGTIDHHPHLRRSPDEQNLCRKFAQQAGWYGDQNSGNGLGGWLWSKY